MHRAAVMVGRRPDNYELHEGFYHPLSATLSGETKWGGQASRLSRLLQGAFVFHACCGVRLL